MSEIRRTAERNDFKPLNAKQIEDVVDIGLRHRSGTEPKDYLAHWLSIARQFAYATHDDSWGEFEKEFAIIIRRLVTAERRATERLEAQLSSAPDGAVTNVDNLAVSITEKLLSITSFSIPPEDVAQAIEDELKSYLNSNVFLMSNSLTKRA